MIHEMLQHDFMRRALLGGIIIGFTNGFLGSFIILRRMALMADALSHSMLPGLAIGLMVAGLNAGSMFSRGSRLKEDTSLAILYTFAFSVGAVLLQFTPTPVDLKHYLFGNILGMGNADLWITWSVALLVVPGLLLLQRPLLLTLFDPAVARSQGVAVGAMHIVIIVASVLTMISSAQSVGVILMLGLLVGPAATMYLLTDRFPVMLWGGAILGCMGTLGGLVLSYRFEKIPSGAAIVIVLFSAFLAAFTFGPRYGLIAKFRKGRHLHDESLERWRPRSE
jgi:manganese transport system permease protein